MHFANLSQDLATDQANVELLKSPVENSAIDLAESYYKKFFNQHDLDIVYLALALLYELFTNSAYHILILFRQDIHHLFKKVALYYLNLIASAQNNLVALPSFKHLKGLLRHYFKGRPVKLTVKQDYARVVRNLAKLQ